MAVKEMQMYGIVLRNKMHVYTILPQLKRNFQCKLLISYKLHCDGINDNKLRCISLKEMNLYMIEQIRK